MMGGRIYTHSLERLVPDFRDRAPLERKVTKERISIGTGNEVTTIEYSYEDGEPNEEDVYKRQVQGETQNPKFIQAMMKHGYKGASDMSNVVSHTFGWDATSDVVPDWVYEGYANKYALDKTVQDWMRNVNPVSYTHLDVYKRQGKG